MPRHDQGLTGTELVDVVGLQVEGRLDDGALTGHDDDLLVLIPEGRAYAPGIAHGEHLAAARQAAHHVAAVEMRHRRAQHVPHLHVVVDEFRDLDALQAQLPRDGIQALDLAVEAVAHQLQGDVGVAHDAGRLSLGRQETEHFVDIGHVEVAAQAEVLRAPVVAAQEGMHELQSALARGRVAEVSHVEMAQEGAVNGLEHLGDRVLAHRPLAEHVLLAHRRVQVDATHARAFLAAVVLLFHQQVELVQGVPFRAVFLFIIRQRFQQADHRHATLMLQRFHLRYRL